MENSRTCEVCKVNIHRASFVKHLRSKKQLEIEKQKEMIIPERLFEEEQTPIKKKIKKVYNPKTLKHIARQNIELDDKELDKELTKKTKNPYYVINENLKNGFKINLDSHNINHANSIFKITPFFPKLGSEFRYINKVMKELSVI